MYMRLIYIWLFYKLFYIKNISFKNFPIKVHVICLQIEINQTYNPAVLQWQITSNINYTNISFILFHVCHIKIDLKRNFL